MEFTGKVIHVSGVDNGISKKSGNQWQKQTIVIEELNQKYPMSIAVSLLNEQLINTVSVGEIVTVFISFLATQYNGKYFNNISAWKINKENQANKGGTNQMPAQPTLQPAPVQQPDTAMPTPDSNDDLPF